MLLIWLKEKASPLLADKAHHSQRLTDSQEADANLLLCLVKKSISLVSSCSGDAFECHRLSWLTPRVNCGIIDSLRQPRLAPKQRNFHVIIALLSFESNSEEEIMFSLGILPFAVRDAVPRQISSCYQHASNPCHNGCCLFLEARLPKQKSWIKTTALTPSNSELTNGLRFNQAIRHHRKSVRAKLIIVIIKDFVSGKCLWYRLSPNRQKRSLQAEVLYLVEALPALVSSALEIGAGVEMNNGE